jgi:hypothetical protein
VSSRLVRSAGGRAVAVEVTVPTLGLDHGCRFTVVGSEIGHSSFRFTGVPTGRPPLPAETVQAGPRVGQVERAGRAHLDG